MSTQTPESFAVVFNDLFPGFIAHPWTVTHLAIFFFFLFFAIKTLRKEFDI